MTTTKTAPTVTADLLKRWGACGSPRRMFADAFPDGLALTPGNAVTAFTLGLDIFWLYEVLTEPAQVEYKRAIASAWAEYERAAVPAQIEYKRAIASAWAEYKRAIASAGAEYKRAAGPARAEYKRAIASAGAEYKRAAGPAGAEYKRAIAPVLVAALLSCWDEITTTEEETTDNGAE